MRVNAKLQFQPFVLSKELGDLRIYLLLCCRRGFLVSLFYQLLDPRRQDLGLGLRLFGFTYLVFIVHRLFLLYIAAVRDGRNIVEQVGFGDELKIDVGWPIVEVLEMVAIRSFARAAKLPYCRAEF